MDAELIELLARYSLTDDRHANLTALASLDLDLLAQLEHELVDEANALHAAIEQGTERSEDSLGAMRDCAAGVEAIRAVVADREQRTRVDADALAATFRPTADEPSASGLPSMAELSRRVAGRQSIAPRIRPTPSIVASSGRPLHGLDDLAAAMSDAYNEWSGERSGGHASGLRFQRVARIPSPIDRDRRLSPDDVKGNDTLMASARQEHESLVASGGFCAPTEPYYSILELGTDARPVKDALPRFVAERGGIRYTRPPTLANVSAGVDVWTNATDITPGGNTKDVYVAACRTVQETLVEAITMRARFGNFNGRAYPEDVAATLRLLATAHARRAEGELLDQLAAASTAVSTLDFVGAARDLLHVWSQAAAAQRSRLRLGGTAPLQLLVPSWAREMIRADLTYAQPGDAALAVTDSEIDGYLATRHLRAAWYEDTATGKNQVFGSQGATNMRNWPGTCVWYLFPPGSFLFLDGGNLDLGIVRDSTLNATNDFESFAETWEAAAYLGSESLAVTSIVCPNGESTIPNNSTSTLCAAS